MRRRAGIDRGGGYLPGVEDMHGICQYPQCRKTAAYNVEGESERAYCKAHCMELFPGREVSNLAGKRCQAAPGCKAQAVWGPKVANGKIQAQACLEHKVHGMLRAGARYCVTDGCTVRAACGFPVEKPVAETCSRHRVPGMVDLRTLRKQRAAEVATHRSDEEEKESEDSFVRGDRPKSRRRPRRASVAEGHTADSDDDMVEPDMKKHRRSPSFPHQHYVPPVAHPRQRSTSQHSKGGNALENFNGAVGLVAPAGVTAAGERRASSSFSSSSTPAGSTVGSPQLVCQAAGPPTPRHVAVGEGDPMAAVQVELVPGDGSCCVYVPYCATQSELSSSVSAIMHEAARVSVSWAKLHHNALRARFGSRSGVRRSHPIDNTVDIKVHAPAGITTTGGVVSEQCQTGQAAAAGCAIACRTIEAFCQCTFGKSVSVVGELTLGGRMLPVSGLSKTLGGFKKKGTVFLAWDSVKDVEDFLPRNTQTYRAKNLASILPALVDNHGDHLSDASVSLTRTKDYACVSSTVPCLQTVEVGVFAGKGEVIMTGNLKLPTLNCLGAALVWLRKNVGNVEDRLRLVRGRRVDLCLDLIKMERRSASKSGHNMHASDEELVDVHINLPGLDLPKSDPSHGPAAVLCLVSVMTGLPLPPGIAVHASLAGNGALQVPPSPSSIAELENAVSAAAEACIRLLLVPSSVETLFKPKFPEHGSIKVVGVGTILDAVQVAFGPYASGSGWKELEQQQQLDDNMVAETRVGSWEAISGGGCGMSLSPMEPTPRLYHEEERANFGSVSSCCSSEGGTTSSCCSSEGDPILEPEEMLVRMREQWGTKGRNTNNITYHSHVAATSSLNQ